MKNILEAPFMVEMIRTTTKMYDHGWDERNGGNISLMLDEKEVAEYLDMGKVLRTIPTAQMHLLEKRFGIRAREGYLK